MRESNLALQLSQAGEHQLGLIFGQGEERGGDVLLVRFQSFGGALHPGPMKRDGGLGQAARRQVRRTRGLWVHATKTVMGLREQIASTSACSAFSTCSTWIGGFSAAAIQSG